MINKGLIIRLSVKQLIFLGAHIGHIKKLSHFLAGWFFLGFRHNIFIINLMRTILLIRVGLKLVRLIARGCRPFWFVTMNNQFAPYLARFANISGEPFNVYDWIGGTLSNYRMILGWMSLLLFILNTQKYKIRNIDKKILILLVGYLNKKVTNKKNPIRLNRIVVRDINRWGRSYNSRRFIKEHGFKNINLFEINDQDDNEEEQKQSKGFKGDNNLKNGIDKNIPFAITDEGQEVPSSEVGDEESKYDINLARKKWRSIRNPFKKEYDEHGDEKSIVNIKQDDAFDKFSEFKRQRSLQKKNRVLMRRLGKLDYKDSVRYLDKLNRRKNFLSRVFWIMNFVRYKSRLNENFDKYNNNYSLFSKDKVYYDYRKKTNVEMFSSYLNIVKTLIKKLNLRLKFMNRYFSKSKLAYNTNFAATSKRLKRFYVNKDIVRMSVGKYRTSLRQYINSKNYFNSKFNIIRRLRGKRRISAQIRKAKKNSSFRKALKRNRWVSPFDPLKKTRKPGGGFVPSYLDNVRIIDEFAVSKTPFITLIDSNVISGDVVVPLPSNDDSLICVNFFCYLITKSLFVGKYSLLSKWKYNVMPHSDSDLYKKAVFLWTFDGEKKKEGEPQKMDNYDDRFDLLLNNFIKETMDKYDAANEIKYKLTKGFELFYCIDHVDTPELNLYTAFFEI